MSELTSKDYWVNYYDESPEDRATIARVCSRYDAFWSMLTEASPQAPASILEIGAFPGRYLAYLAARFGWKPTGLDYNPDKEKFRRTMEVMGVRDFTYVCDDFLKFSTAEKFDIVYSNGFIEHFTNYDELLDRHSSLVKEGGYIMVMIPNKRYLRSLYGNLVDRENQKIHNLKCMSLDVFRGFAKRNQLEVKHLGYFGGFPYKVHAKMNFVQRGIYSIVRFLSIRLNGLIVRYPSRWWSSAIICVCRKPGK